MAYSKSQLYERIVAILVREFEIPIDELSLETNLESDLDFDSLDAAALATWLEDETGVTLSNEDLEAMRTVSDIVERTQTRLAASA